MFTRHPLLGAAVSILLLPAAVSTAATVFVSTLTGANERPNPTNSIATGFGTGELTGGPGAWEFTYHIEYQNLTPGNPDFLAAHIHDTTEPPGNPPTEQFGPVVHPLDQLESPINGAWRTDDGPPFALTDELAAKLMAGELYFNIHSEAFPSGEIRGQIVPIPLPSPLLMAGAGLCAVVAATTYMRRRAMRL